MKPSNRSPLENWFTNSAVMGRPSQSQAPIHHQRVGIFATLWIPPTARPLIGTPAFKQQHFVSLRLPPALHQEGRSASSPTTAARVSLEKLLLWLDILHCLALFTYVKCGTKYLLNFPHKRPNSEHSWKQFIVSLYTLTRALCHCGRSHKAEQEPALPYHLSQCSLRTKSITHI